MTKPEPILIGFFPKKTERAPSWLGVTSVEEICSVSNCISKPPKNWIDHWKHNMTWWLYDTEDVAWAITESDPESYDMYAYRMFPVVFEGTTESPLAVESTATGDLSDYDFVGYDAVSREQEVAEFCHSPLSCNKALTQYKVNRFCLMDELEEAWRVTREIARDAKEKKTWEPGSYYLCAVYRKTKQKMANQVPEDAA
jgi:hypothetical protein